jgi:glycerol-3-phosphate acyltransferase PlsY
VGPTRIELSRAAAHAYDWIGFRGRHREGVDGMDNFVEMLGTAVLAYLIGSIPASYLVARYVVGVDVREIGEGNAGARNVFHEVGTSWGVVTFFADFGKGALVALLFVDAASSRLLLAGVFVFLGHAYPVWLRFIGGKGLATVGGFSFVLIPWAAVVGAASAGVAWSLTRRFLPTTVVAVVAAIVAAPLLGYRSVATASVLGLFVLTGVKRGLDEPRMRRIEARTGWDRLTGGTGS